MLVFIDVYRCFPCPDFRNFECEDSTYSEICPAEIKFRGTITSESPGRSIQVLRSDGALLPIETLEFGHAGS